MNAKKVNVSYDPDSDVLSIESVSRATIDHAKEMGNLVVHFGKNEEPLLVEVLEASKTFRGQARPLSRVAELAKVV